MSKVPNLREIVAANVRALKLERGIKSQKAIAKKMRKAGCDIDQTTVGRILNARISTTIDIIEGLAAALELEPWQLLVPGLDPKHKPLLRAVSQEERALWKRIEESAKSLGLT